LHENRNPISRNYVACYHSLDAIAGAAERIGKQMCNCINRDFKVVDGRLYGEYDGDFHQYDDESYSYCPICGEKLTESPK